MVVDVRDGHGNRTGAETLYTPRTFGHWKKAAYKFPAPDTPNGKVLVRATAQAELMEIDAVRVMHVSDRLNSTLRRFIQGADPQ